MTPEAIKELAKVKALFQQRAILAAMGVTGEIEQCAVCGDSDCDELVQMLKECWDVLVNSGYEDIVDRQRESLTAAIKELAKVKAIFQQSAILAAMGVDGDKSSPIESKAIINEKECGQ